MPLSESDWLDVCRRAGAAARSALADFSTTEERSVKTGRGEGGDATLAIDRAAEDAILAVLEAERVPLTAVSEERGEVAVAGGGVVRVVIDPVDGSFNAKRGLPFACVSIAVASGPLMEHVQVAWVGELDPPRDWWALRGGGAWRDGVRLPPLRPGPLEVLGLEGARPELVAAHAQALADTGATRVRALGAVATSMCLVAAGRLDAMLSIREVRSVDVAAAQLLVREAGGTVALPGGDALDLEMRSRVVAARDGELVERLLGAF